MLRGRSRGMPPAVLVAPTSVDVGGTSAPGMDAAALARSRPTALANRAFRPDIQALRALAVGVVVAYHLWPSTFPGGFIGVDVFFVISGFLITQHLIGELRRSGRVSLVSFWARRIRRLLPAAGFVLTACLMLLLVMPRITWDQNLSEIRAAAAYAENWILGLNAIDYLAAENTASLVQHYWSLSAEEQFYLMWPLLIVAAAAVARRVLHRDEIAIIALTLAGVLVVSFAASVVLTQRMGALAFFATPLRSWEFAAGGLLAVASQRRKGVSRDLGRSKTRALRLLPWLGWLIIVGGTFFIVGSSVQFPGWVAVVPVGGALLCLGTGQCTDSFGFQRFVRSEVLQWLGEHSYSIYLWHWPLIIAWPWIARHDPGLGDKLLIVLITAVLAWMTKKWVEDPFRLGAFWRRRTRRSFYLALGLTLTLVGVTTISSRVFDTTLSQVGKAYASVLGDSTKCVGAAALVTGCQGAFSRPSPDQIAFAGGDFDLRMNSCQQRAAGARVVACTYGARERARHTVAVVGNSHAVRLIPGLDAWGAANNVKILLLAKTDCLGIAVDVPDGGLAADCRDWSRAVQRTLTGRGDVSLVLLASHVAANTFMAAKDGSASSVARARAATVSTFQSYRDAGIKVLVAGDVPGTRPDAAPKCVAADTSETDPCHSSRSEVDLPNLLTDVAIANPSLTAYTSLADLVCDAKVCHSVIGKMVVYSDSHHLTTMYSRSMAPYLGASVLSSLETNRNQAVTGVGTQ